MFLTIVTVCFNSEKTIRRTLESVLSQDFQDYEYLVVDGASRDGTLDILREYEPKFSGRMRWHSEPDKGIYDAMNKGIRQARGEYIGLINSDDYYLPNAFTRVWETVQAAGEKPDVVYSDMDRVNEKGECVKTIPGDPSKMWKGMFVNHPTCFVSRGAYDRFGLFDTGYRTAADYDLMLRMVKGGGCFAKAPEKLSVLTTGGASFLNLKGEKEKFRIQRNYYPLPLCCYVYLRSVYACVIRPFFRKLLGKKDDGV